ncbi:rhodanese-like domain-containing protein [Streptomyces parvus]|uniref:rhodanese-like domain-containing protein n=1 Tax=Streptomyces parvus TaxID=66428 RepID=UPI00382CCDCB
MYVICASGNRSQWAADRLAAVGVDAVSVAGGTRGWVGAGRPVVTGSAPGVV